MHRGASFSLHANSSHHIAGEYLQATGGAAAAAHQDGAPPPPAHQHQQHQRVSWSSLDKLEHPSGGKVGAGGSVSWGEEDDDSGGSLQSWEAAGAAALYGADAGRPLWRCAEGWLAGWVLALLLAAVAVNVAVGGESVAL